MFRLVTLCSLLLMLTSVHGRAIADFAFSDFSTTDGLNIVGDAMQFGNEIRITPAETDQHGTVWYEEPQDQSARFRSTFEFRFTEQGGIPDVNNLSGGDGIAFNFANDGNLTQTFSTGHDFTVVFDTWDNGADDPSSNSVRLRFLGSQLGQVDLTPFGINMSDGQVHEAMIEYAPGTASVAIDSQNVLSVPGINLQLITGTTYVGIGSFNGAAFENHDLLSWSLVVPEPSTLAIVLAGVVLGIGRPGLPSARRRTAGLYSCRRPTGT